MPTFESPAYRERPPEQRLSALRLELDRLRAISPLRRAVLPPATVHELDALCAQIDTTLARASGQMLATLEALTEQLTAVLVRSNAEVERMRARLREVSPPPAPQRFALGSHKLTFSIEKPFRDQLRRASEVRAHGVGMLASFRHRECPLVFVARGRRSDHVFPMRKLDGFLRTAAPRGPSFSVAPRSLFRRLFPARGEVVVDPVFDTGFIVKGDAPVARALLDAGLRQRLSSMQGELIVLSIERGSIDLVWRRPFDPARTAVLPDAAVDIVTSIAQRLYAA